MGEARSVARRHKRERETQRETRERETRDERGRLARACCCWCVCLKDVPCDWTGQDQPPPQRNYVVVSSLEDRRESTAGKNYQKQRFGSQTTELVVVHVRVACCFEP